jgi:hypothetical protein
VRPGDLQSFSASYDSTAKIVSAVVIVLFAAVAIALRSTIIAGFEAVLLILSYAYSPRGYAVADRTIVIKRLIGNVVIPLDGIRELRSAAADDLSGCIRLFGSGGLFGWYGLFRTSKLGKCTWYVTNRRKSVVLVTGARTVVVSPDDVDAFMGAMPRATSSDPLLDAMASYPAGSLAGKLIGGVLAIAVISVVGIANLYAPGPPSYTLTPAALTIHDRFYPVTVNRDAVDVDHIRIVDFAHGLATCGTHKRVCQPALSFRVFPCRQRQDDPHVPRRQQAPGASPAGGQRYCCSS